MIVTVSTPGKLHLLGEHAVVYGFPALIASVDRRIYVKIRNHPISNRGFKSVNTIIYHPKLVSGSKNNEFILKTIELFVKTYKIDNLSPLEITINSQIPVGSGMGSSAALSSALLGALLKFIKNIWNPVKINEIAYEAEKIAHGNPSGADNSACVFGGLVWYRKEFEFLKSIWNLTDFSYKIPQFAIVDSGRPNESTKEMVDIVRMNYSKQSKQFEEIFYDQEKQTKKLLISLKTGDNKLLKESIIKGENNLEKIGVVGQKAVKIIREIENLGGAAKICGAGGLKENSGIILVFHQNLKILKSLEKKLGVTFENISLGQEGIRLENTV
jgi:mevalonate kinase